MKKLLIILMAVFYLSGCTKKDNELYQKKIWILIDVTDPVSTEPDSSNFFAKLNLDKDIYQGCQVSISEISEKDINRVETISLPAQNHWLGSQSVREAAVRKFKKEVKDKLSGMAAEAHGSQEHSIIYRQMCRALNDLAQSHAEYRALVVFSDLMENSSVSFYNPLTFKNLQKSVITESIVTEGGDLADLTGIHAYFLYVPADYEQNTKFMVAATFFARILQRKHCKVHIGDNL